MSVGTVDTFSGVTIYTVPDSWAGRVTYSVGTNEIGSVGSLATVVRGVVDEPLLS